MSRAENPEASPRIAGAKWARRAGIAAALALWTLPASAEELNDGVDQLVIDALGLQIGAVGEASATSVGNYRRRVPAIRAWSEPLASGQSSAGFGGFDYLVSDRFLAGVALGSRERTLGLGGGSPLARRDSTVAPYAGLVINQYLSAEVVGGYAFGERADSRVQPLRLSTDGAGGEAWDHWFVGGGVNGQYSLDRLTLSGRASVLWMVEGQDAGAGTDHSDDDGRGALGQFRFGGTVGYSLGRIEPYVAGAFAQEIEGDRAALAPSTASADGGSGFEFGGGVNFSLSESIVGGVQGVTRLGADDVQPATTFSGNLRIKF